MLRFVASTCGVVFEALAFHLQASAAATGVAAMAMICGAMCWWSEVRHWIDGIVGLDLEPTSLGDYQDPWS